MNVSPTKCIDGKRHQWRTITSDMYEPTLTREYKWCMRCGTLTEFRSEWHNGKLRTIRAQADDKPYAEIPMCHKTTEEIREELVAHRKEMEDQYGEIEEVEKSKHTRA